MAIYGENYFFIHGGQTAQEPLISGQPLTNEKAVEQPILKLGLLNFISSFNFL